MVKFVAGRDFFFMLPAQAGSTFSNLNGPRPPSWANLGQFGPTCDRFGPTWCYLRPTYASLALTWAILGPNKVRETWKNHCFHWFLLYFLNIDPHAILRQLGANLDQLGANFVPTWCQLGTTLGPTLSQLGLTWGQLGPTWA